MTTSIPDRHRHSVAKPLGRLSGFLLLFWAGSILADHPTIRIGVYHNPPKILFDSTAKPPQISGFFGELIVEIARLEGWSLEPIECQWQQCLTLLQAGDIDLLPDVAITEERKTLMNFHQTPALHSWSQVFSRKDVDITSILDLDHKSLAVLNGSVQQRHLEQLAREFNLNVTLMVVNSFQEGLELLSQEQADALATNNLFGSFHAQAYSLKPTAIIFQPSQLFFAAPKDQSAAQLGRIDYWLTQWSEQTDSPYQEILQHWQTARTIVLIPRSFWIATGALLSLLALLVIGLTRMKRQVHLTQDELRKTDDKFSDLLTTQQQKVHHLSYYDALTGLANRRLFIERLDNVLDDLQAKPGNGALILLDIDSFRNLNDTLGHDLGDQLLSQVADRLKQLHLTTHMLARFGGDEFTLLLEQLDANTFKQLTEVEDTIEAILSAFVEPFMIKDQEISASLSFGVVTFSEKNSSSSELIQQAELALFDAKRAGRQQLRFFDKQMQAQAEQRTQIELGLQQAVRNDELHLYYQPQYHDQRLIGAEVLLRWQPNQADMISPAAFIPVAESTGLILPIGQWILTQACHQLVQWSKHAETASLTLAVNISAVQMRHKEFVPQVISILETTQAPASRLEFELTESMLIDNVEDTIDKINQLKQRGIHFSLDDFGTGFSSLSMLTRFPLDTLKVDQSFVRDMHRDRRDFSVVKTIIELGRGLSLNVIAEGVETAEQKASLQQLGCQQFQGYYFAKPMPIEQFMQHHGFAHLN